MNFLAAKKWKKRLGAAGEKTAARMLCDAGYDVLLRNCRTPRGEIDIVARDGASLVFAEVKTLYRRWNSKRELHPVSGLRTAQKRRLLRAARSYLRDMGNPSILYRFDLIEIIYDFTGPREIRHWKNHFSAEPR